MGLAFLSNGRDHKDGGHAAEGVAFQLDIPKPFGQPGGRDPQAPTPDDPPLLQSHYTKRLASSSGGAWQGWWQSGAVRLLWAFLGSGGDGKDHPGQGNPYGFTFAIQPRSQPLSMFGAATGTACSVVADHVTGFAVPRLIERDSAPFNGPRDGLTPHQSVPLALSITTISQD